MNKNEHKIIANFKDGQHYGLGLHYVLFIGGLCAPAMVVGLVFVLIIEFDFAFVFLIVFAMFFLILCVYCYIKLLEQRKNIKKALQDAVMVDAVIKRIQCDGWSQQERVLFYSQCVAEFVYDNKEIQITSGKPRKMKPFIKQHLYDKYIDRRIKVLYSPSQQEILIPQKWY